MIIISRNKEKEVLQNFIKERNLMRDFVYLSLDPEGLWRHKTNQN